jgi:S1-C subfamily serine protease
MPGKAYCDRPIKHLFWVILLLTIIILIGTYFYAGSKASESRADTGGAVVKMPIAQNAEAVSAVDAVTMATPKGGLKLVGGVGQTNAAPDASALLSPAPLANIQEMLNNVAATANPSVVHIEVLRPGPAGAGNIRTESIGSGVIVDRRGYVLTNYHVLKDATRISVTTCSKAGNATYEARIVHSDIGADLAVIQILGETDFPVAKLGDSSTLEVGDWVMAIGSPLDLIQTVSLGIISALRETVRIGGVTYYEMIQTDAHINKGNSGGPLVNIDGEVVGVNTAIYAPDGGFTGVGFAIPIDHAKVMLNELNVAQHRFTAVLADLTKSQMSVLKKGRWLGVEGLSVSPDLSAKFDLATDRGVYVANVYVNSPADRAGLRRGDIIVWLDDRKIGGLEDLRSALGGAPAGQEIALRVCRGNRVYDVSAITSAKW